MQRLTDRGEEILLLYRQKEQDWTFPKGHIENGEDAAQAMVRELKEETGLDVRLLSPLPDHDYLSPFEGQVTIHMFLAEPIDPHQPFHLEHSGDEPRWMPANKVVEQLSYENLKSYFLTCKVESFDIVDKHNLLIGKTKSRDVVHTELSDWHRTTHIWIVNSKKEILCQQRSLTKDKNPGKWQSFFGGHLQAGQTYESNALKELSEELGIEAKATDLTPIYVKQSDEQKHFGQVYLMRWDGELSTLHFDDGEVAQAKWMTIAELQEKMAAGIFCNRLDQKVLDFMRK